MKTTSVSANCSYVPQRQKRKAGRKRRGGIFQGLWIERWRGGLFAEKYTRRRTVLVGHERTGHKKAQGSQKTAGLFVSLVLFCGQF
ncbi:MAG: hypothetical protein ACKV2V_15775, partial [Blastocatellia bacterium]